MRRFIVARNWHTAQRFLVDHLPSFIVLDLIPIRPLGFDRGWLFEARIKEAR